MSKAEVKPEAPVFVLESRDQVVEAIAEIGRRRRERAKIETDMNAELAYVRQRYEEQAQPHTDAIKGLSAGVEAYCAAHRPELTDGGKSKTAHLASGDVHWRQNPASVEIRSQDTVLGTFRRLGLTQFIRTKDEVNKQAILADPEAARGIKGITIKKGKEEFEIEPFETPLEAVG